MKMKSCDVLGLGTPIIDHLIVTTHEALARLPGKLGGSEPVDYDTFTNILTTYGRPLMLAPGGSAANTIKGLSMLGKSCCIFGKVGDDEAGKAFTEGMQSAGVATKLLVSKEPTAQVACLITPDNGRTMRSCLGAGFEMSSKELPPEIFEGVKLVHIEGYLADRPDLMLRAMELAKGAGALVSFDLSSHEMVDKHKKQMVDLIAKNVDILFANQEETKSITGMDPEKGCLLLKDVCPTAVVKMGPGGCWVANQHEYYHQEAIVPPKIVDTTGAGDLFASGFLYGILEGADMRSCAHYGALLASYVITVMGTDMPDHMWKVIKEEWTKGL